RFVTTSVRPTLPEEPAVYVTVWRLFALVIVPFVMDQSHAPAAGPEAVLPDAFAHTEAGVGVIVGAPGFAVMGTLTVFEAEQLEPFVTTSVRPTLPDAPAEYVIVWTFAALVMVPFTIDQAYVAAPAGPWAMFPVEPAQTAAGVEIDGAGGVALMGTSTLFCAGQFEAFVTTSVSPTLPEAPALYVMV